MPRPYFNRGVAYHHKGDYDRALGDYNRVLGLNPNYAEAYNNRGVAYHEQGDHERAIEDFNTAIALKPHYAEPYNNRGTAYEFKSEVDNSMTQPNGPRANPAMIRAIKDYNSAIGLNPALAIAYYNRGVAWLRFKEWERAESDLTTAAEKGIDIITEFRNDYGRVPDFEGGTGVQLLGRHRCHAEPTTEVNSDKLAKQWKVKPKIFSKEV